MKMFRAIAIMAVGVAPAAADSPTEKVVQLLTDLSDKVTAEGAASAKAFEEYTAFCEDRTRELKFEIKTGSGEVDQLNAVIAEETATLNALAAKIDELTTSIATDEEELKKATEIRATESSDFAASEKELTETIDTIERASVIIAREMAKGASMAQMLGVDGIAQALTALVQASSVGTADKTKLMALMQQQSGDEDVGAPDAAVYESHSSSISDALDSLMEKAQEQLADARKAETEALHAYEMKKQGLEDSLKFANKDLDAAKKNTAAASEKKAAAEGDLDATSKALAADETSLAELTQECMDKAESYEAEKASREAELKAIAAAKAAVVDATSGANSLTYSLVQSPAFVQLKTQSGARNEKAMRAIRKLAFEQQDTALERLASRVEYAMHSNGDDAFAKVKGLISDMLEKLTATQNAEDTQKAFCDKEKKETTEKTDEATAEHDKLNTKLDQAASRIEQLAEELATLDKELAELAKMTVEMNKLRAEEKATFTANKPEMEQGIEGVKLAIKILREYYAADADHDAAEGAGAGIVSLLEVCESDFSKLLATMVADEEKAAAEYDTQTKENDITKTTKDKDVEYKTKEKAGLEKTVTELKSDAAGVKEQLDALNEYMAKLEEQCTHKVETYADRKARFEAEITGLKQALDILNEVGSESLLQRASIHRFLGA